MTAESIGAAALEELFVSGRILRWVWVQLFVYVQTPEQKRLKADRQLDPAVSWLCCKQFFLLELVLDASLIGTSSMQRKQEYQRRWWNARKGCLLDLCLMCFIER